MPPASRLVESVFERFVAEDGLEERVYHLGHDPYPRYLLECIHTFAHTLTCFRYYLRVGGAHLVL
jgi:hypothetical protein